MSVDRGSHHELLQPLYRASATLKGRFRASARFRPLRVIKQILALQVSFWLTIVAFQLTFLTLPSLLVAGVGELRGRWRGVFWPSFKLLFSLTAWTPLTFLSVLNGVCFLAASFVR